MPETPTSFCYVGERGTQHAISADLGIRFALTFACDTVHRFPVGFLRRSERGEGVRLLHPAPMTGINRVKLLTDS